MRNDNRERNRNDMHRIVTAGAFACFSLTACGLEGAIHEIFDTEHEPLATVIEGNMDNMPPDDQFFLITADGGELFPIAADIDRAAGTFELNFEAISQRNALLVAAEGEKRLMRYIPFIEPNERIEGINLNSVSTAGTLILQTAMSAQNKAPQTLEASLVEAFLDDVEAPNAENQPVVDFVDAVINAADGLGEGNPWVTPVYTSSGAVSVSAMNPTWWADKGDQVTQSLSEFDAALWGAAQVVNFEGCIDPTLIRVVLEVVVAEPRLDGSCTPITQTYSRWVTDQPNARMFFVGGVHEESFIQDAIIDQAMGNSGNSWQPNTVPMFDDGTNGDAVADDNIWTLTFDMPRPGGTAENPEPMRVGYKFTWGLQGDRWTGTEEWPGNQRILEIVDVNGDNFVYRRDSFGDERSNKDIGNLQYGNVNWGDDFNNDGIPETYEQPLHTSAEPSGCYAEFASPQGIGPRLDETAQPGMCPEI
ncbi:MAG: choice-of-anchor X domain-containing protein [Myxococcota bacterium]